MKTNDIRAQIIRQPFAHLLQGARVDAFLEEPQPGGLEVVLDLQGFEVESSKLFEKEGKLHERLLGQFVPLRLRFPISGSLRFYARDVLQEYREGQATFQKVERDWSPAPPMPTGFVPEPKELYEQFAGDPVTVSIDGVMHERLLFVGGVETQGRQRPAVDAVLNLGEEPSIWAKGGEPHPEDRWVQKGEGKDAMTIPEIKGEAQWVIERLRAGKKVLVHCVAGMNRTATVACAALMMLEGLNAEAALARVREQHPWSRPDPTHWLRLRAMSEKK